MRPALLLATAQRLLTALLTTALVACGGSSGSATTPPLVPPPVPTPAPGGSAPEMPAGVVVTVEPTVLNVFWNEVDNATSYTVYYSRAPGVDDSSASVTASASPVAITGLTEGTTYYLRISASNAAGTSTLTAERSARTSNPPDAVTAFTVTATDGGARVSWDAATDATRYTVFASTTPGDVSGAITVSTQLLSIAVEGLVNGTTYFVSVRAENIEGLATRSIEQAVTPVAGTQGAGWSEQTLINEPYDFFDRDNYLGGAAINDNGVAAATWIFAGMGDGNNFVMVNHTVNGSWQTEEILALEDNASPRVAVTPDGTIVVVWLRFALDQNAFRTGATLVSRRFRNGSWSELEDIAQIDPGASIYAGAPAIAADGNGNVIATWWQNQTSMWAARYADNAWAAPTRLGESVRTLGPAVVGTSAGSEAIVAWIQDTEPNDSSLPGGGPSRASLFASRYDGAVWTTARVGHTDLADFDAAGRARIDVNATGDAVIVWQQTRDNSNGDGFRVDAVRYAATSGTWSAPETIVARDWQVPSADVAIDANANAVASWQPTDLADNSSQRVLEAALFDATTGAWGPAFAINEDDGVTEPRPVSIEMRENGNVFALWSQTDGVFWRRFTASAQQWEPIERIGVFRSVESAAAMSRNGHTIVVHNPQIIRNNSFEYAVYALLYRP